MDEKEYLWQKVKVVLCYFFISIDRQLAAGTKYYEMLGVWRSAALGERIRIEGKAANDLRRAHSLKIDRQRSE